MLTTLLAADFDIRDVVQQEEALPGYDLAVASGAGDSGFSVLVGDILTAAFAIVGLLLLLYLIWGGIDWITSGGDQSKVTNARNKITQAAIGLIVFASAFAIINIIQLAFGLNLINFTASKSTSSSSTKSVSEITKERVYLTKPVCEMANKAECERVSGGYKVK